MKAITTRVLHVRKQLKKAGQTVFNLKVTLPIFPDYTHTHTHTVSEDFAPQYLDFLLHKHSYDTVCCYQQSQRD